MLLGAVSEAYEARWNGIVTQAVIATLSVFLVMAVLYRSRMIRATPRFTRVGVGASQLVWLYLEILRLLSYVRED